LLFVVEKFDEELLPSIPVAPPNDVEFVEFAYK
jgi:hypothetical protein